MAVGHGGLRRNVTFAATLSLSDLAILPSDHTRTLSPKRGAEGCAVWFSQWPRYMASLGLQGGRWQQVAR